MSGQRRRALSRPEIEAFADQLHRLVAELDAGNLTATPVERARIEGAIVALDAVLGCDPAAIVARLSPPGAPVVLRSMGSRL